MSPRVGIAVMLLGLLWLGSIAAADGFTETVLFQEDTGGFTQYRIPGIVVTSKGTVIAYCEARKFTESDRGEIEIHLRRSTDGGKQQGQALRTAAVLLAIACKTHAMHVQVSVL